MKILSFIIMIFTISCGLSAQHDDTIKVKPLHYILTEAGVSHASYRDAGLSPLIYTGTLPIFSLGHKATKPQYILENRASFQFGNLIKTISGTSYNTTIYHFNYVLDYYRTIQSVGKDVSYFLGAGTSYDLTAGVSPHYTNSQFVMNNNISLSINCRIQYDFFLKSCDRKFIFFKCKRPQRNYSLFLNLSIPFASIFQTPGFSYVSHATINDDDEFEYYKWHVLLFSGFRTEVGVIQYLQNGNAFGLSYKFHLFSSKSNLNNYMQMADQSLLLSLQYRFK